MPTRANGRTRLSSSSQGLRVHHHSERESFSTSGMTVAQMFIPINRRGAHAGTAPSPVADDLAAHAVGAGTKAARRSGGTIRSTVLRFSGVVPGEHGGKGLAIVGGTGLR
jgi:hypothetical protein